MCEQEAKQLFSAMVSELNKAEQIALCGHVMPDGDCLGAMLALGLALRQMGKKVVFYSPDPVPELYAFLPCADEIHVELEQQCQFDLFVSVDCSVPDRLGHFQVLLGRAGRVAVLDHHTGSVPFGNTYLNLPVCAATGEIVYDLLRWLPVLVDEDIATCLYVAIVTDTGSFSYDNTGSLTHLRAAELLKLGVKAAWINKRLYEEKPLVSLQVLSTVLQSLELSGCGRVAWMFMQRDTLHRLNATDEHVDGLVNYPRLIKGVELALFFREIEDGKYKVSLRSKYYLDVNKLATLFGGGGHPRAAGCVMEGNLEDVKHQLLQAALPFLKDE
ncbi:Bifunctional oligoribonuclease and PAP phosphatase NrnA [Sporotomaculum syntrophicum]|uniref:Bifunctional oligoribonuclease and PAP phosphatase NrnA n=1 Tax=Sporotomaculum syntrophicum TaxID=182264 RepID=A0A9D2WPK1_9FIRM|nr:bifunctional oligoribonuclease/PAP phosphatase NrnA [Sporotomaculum syntrophicum]KAF1084571.1 Bifunctional oligoribonuclease and PAP phosphatase NrnA [Sporotomaculum syntrophicum]